MKRRILAALLALLMMLALLPAQSLAADTGFQTEAVPDADYDGIPDEFDPAPNENSFSGNYKSGDFNASIAYTMDYREFFEDNTVYNKNIAGCSTWASQFTYENEDNGTVYTPSVPLRDADGSSISKIYHVDQLMRAHGMENVIDYKVNEGYFDQDISMSAYSDDDIAEAFYGHHKVSWQGQTIEVIAVFVRGTNKSVQEWSSNFNVGNLARFGQEYDAAEGKLRFPNGDWTRKSNHRGFDVTANRFRKALKDYMGKFVDPEATPVFWLSGHSRGGSITNIMASDLVDQGEKVFAYTFASPNTTANTEASAVRYDCIFNLVNGDDFVPRLPMPEWGFTRYGRTATLFASTASSAQRSALLGNTSYNYKSDSDLKDLCGKFVKMTVNNAGGNDGWRDVNVYHCGHQHADEQSGEYRTGCIRTRQWSELIGWGESMFTGWSQRVQRYAYWSSADNGICETPAYAMQVLAELMGNLSLSGGWDYLTTNKLADRYDFGKTSLINYATGIIDPHYMENYYLIQKLIEAQNDPDAAYTNEASLYTDDQHRPVHEHSYTVHPYDDHQPSCTEPGLGWKECKCSEINADWYDDVVRDVEIPALGHDLHCEYLGAGTHAVHCSRCETGFPNEPCIYENNVCIACGHVKAASRLVTVYVVDELDGQSLYAWAWGDAGNLDAAWPGHALTAIGNDKNGHPFYSIELDLADYDKLILNRNGQPQTGELDIAAAAGQNDYVIYYIYGVSGNDLSSSQGTDIWPAPGTVTEPSCTECGYTVYTGMFTGEIQKTDETAPLGHLPGEPVQENYVESGVDADGGYDTVVYCQRCSAELSREHTVLPAYGLGDPIPDETIKIYPSITIGIAFYMNFSVRKDAVDQYDHWYIEVSKLNADGTVSKTTRFGEGQEGAVEDGMIYNVRYNDISAKEMGVRFRVTVHAFEANGQEHYSSTLVGGAEENTVRDYLITELLKEDNEDAVRTLAADLLNYGAAAQKYFQYDDENLVNMNLSDIAQTAMTQFATADEAPANLKNSANGPNVYGSVSVKNRVILGLAVRNIGTAEHVQIRIKRQDGTVKDTIDAERRGEVWTAYYDSLEAEDMRVAYDFIALADEIETGTALTWSVEGYVYAARQNEDTTEVELALYNALLIYTDSAQRAMTNNSRESS